MNHLLKGAVAATALMAGTHVNAQGVSLYGVRAEANVGLDRFHSEGNRRNKLGYGGEVGIDALLSQSFVLGGYGSLWISRAENITRDGAGIAARKSFEEYSFGARAGALITPTTLIYGKLGWAINEQRKRFTPDRGAQFGYYNKYNTMGLQYGVGIEQSISDNVYWKAEGRYSDYRTHSHRIAALVGVGVRFGRTFAEPVLPPPPPPPAPPPAPAMQTCPDGALILATDTCPAPPPPPPPPPPPAQGERG